MDHSLPDLLERILSVGGQPPYESDRRSLLHAYVACLNFDGLCTAIGATINEAVDVRLAVRGRLLRLLREARTDEDLSSLVNLVEQTAIAANENKQLRPPIDALHSAVFEYLPLPVKQMLLDRWIDRGTRGAAARWLKATKVDPDLFDTDVALAFWRASKDARAAKSLAYQAPPEKLAHYLQELIETCEQGWIISKAVLRAGSANDACWEAIHAKHPSTYLYLCAQTGRKVNEHEAFELVCRCPGLAVEGGRGLAIWAIGQMRMISVLDRVRDAADEFHQIDTAELFAPMLSETDH